MDNNTVRIVRVSGPVVIAEDVNNAKMYDVVRVGKMGLVGEIIRIRGNRSTIQVYEDTSGIRPDEAVENTERPLSVRLGPGLLTSIYDGIQRPFQGAQDFGTMTIEHQYPPYSWSRKVPVSGRPGFPSQAL